MLRKQLWLAAATVFSLVLLFALVTWERLAGFGRYPVGFDFTWRINSHYALNGVRNLLAAGPQQLGYRVYITPVSRLGESFTPPYISYPLLYLLLPWFISAVSGLVPTMGMLTVLAFIAHAIFAASLGAIFYRLALDAGYEERASLGWAFLAGALGIVIPGFVFLFQIWWPDMLGMLFLAPLVLSELSPPKNRHVRFTLWFLAGLADWLCYFSILLIVFKRFTAPGRQRWREPLLPLALAFSVKVLEIWATGGFASFGGKLLERSRWVSPGQPPLLFTMLDQSLTSFGRVAFFSACALGPFLFFAFYRRKRLPDSRRKLVEAATLLIGPSLLHFVFLQEHYRRHEYEWWRIGSLACFAVILFPPLFASTYSRSRRWKIIALCTAAMAAGAYGAFLPALLRERLATARYLDPIVQSRCDALYGQFRKDDSFVSPNFANSDNFFGFHLGDPKLDLGNSLCFPIIQLAPTAENLSLLINFGRWSRNPRTSGMRIVVVFLGPPPAEWRPFLQLGSRRQAADLELYDIDWKAYHLI